MFDFDLCRENCSGKGQCFGDQKSNATAEDTPVQETDAPICSATAERLNKQAPQSSAVTMGDINPKWMAYYDGGWPPREVILGPPPRGVSVGDAADFAVEEEDESEPPPPAAGSTSNSTPGRQLSPPTSDTMSNGPSRKELPPDTRTCCGCIYSPVAKMEEVEVLKKACWCVYCCCGGFGFHRWPAHLRLAYKCIACRQSFDAVECHGVHDGLCAQANTCCWCLSMCHLPPRRGTPRCICCNEPYCGYTQWGKDLRDHEHAEENVAGDARVGDLDHFLHETNVLCWSCCTGCSVASACVAYHIKYKCCCCKCKSESTCPCDGDGCCNCLLTCWWCLAQSRFPPSFKPDRNPLIGCCGCTLRKCCRSAHHIGPHGPGSKSAAPRQQEMR